MIREGAVRVLGSFAGGNPQATGAIRTIAPGSFLVKPFVEPDSSAYKFRMDVNVENPSGDRQGIELLLDWDEPTYMKYRNEIYTRTGPGLHDWKPIAGTPVPGSDTVRFNLTVPPGVTECAFQPRYGEREFHDLASFCGQSAAIDAIEWNGSDSGFPFIGFHCRRGPGREAARRKCILAVGRVHPYETAGSYCLDGFLRHIAEDEAAAAGLLSRRDFLVFPVIGWDGVRKGCCRLNGHGGIDLARTWDDRDEACRLISAVIGKYRIDGVLDIHNWMHPDLDGLKFTGWNRARRFTAAMKPVVPRCRWKTAFRWGVLEAVPEGVMGRVKERTGARCLALEFPWKGRTPGQMKSLGVAAMQAFLDTIVES